MKKALSLMLALALTFGIFAVMPLIESRFDIVANAASVEDLTFTLNSDGVSYSVSDCNEGVTGDLTVPAEYQGLPVTMVGEKAFYNCAGLVCVTLPDGIVQIGNSAFAGCEKLENVNLPDSITSLGYWVFKDCISLKEAVLPENVTTIPQWTFAGCYDLESVELNNKIRTISNCAFRYCTSLSEIELPATVKNISDEAFSYSAIIEMYLPEGITSIKTSVFNSCSELRIITIPDSVSKISNKAFNACDNIERVYYSGSSDAWASISVGSYNTPLTEAQTHYGVPADQVETHYGEGVVTVEPDCLNEGEIYYTCPCGHDYTEVLPALGHDMTAEWIVEKEATCTATGYKYHECKRCGTKADETAIPVDAEAHDYSGEWVISSAATCTSVGSKHKECLVCGAKSEAQTISATGHSVSGWVTDSSATCTSDGSKHKECTVCGEVTETVVLPATGHVASEWMTVSSNEKQKVCTVCGAVLEKETTAIKVEKLDSVKGIKVTNAVDGVQINWNEVENANGYIVYRKVKGGKWERIAKLSEISYTDKAAKSGTTYYYTVKAYNGKVTSQKYYSVSVKFLEAPKLECTKAKKFGFELKWNKIKGAQGYIVYRMADGGEWVRLAKLNKNNKTSFVDVNPLSGKSYYTVKAYSGSYKSAFCEDVCVSYLAAPKVTKLSNGAKGVDIGWSKVNGADGYAVYRIAKGGKWELLTKTAENTFTDKDAKSGTTYEYKVEAYNENSKAESSKVSIKYLATPVLKEITGTKKAITIKWNKVDGAKEYTVYRKTDGGSWKSLGKVKGDSYTDKSVKEGVKYTYTVRATNGGTASYYDTVGLSYVIEVAQPEPETNKENVISVKATKKGAEVKWDKVDGADGYKVYRRNADGSWKKIADVKGTAYTDRSAKKGVTYEYKIESYTNPEAPEAPKPQPPKPMFPWF